jgi:hypothetical protein
VHSALKHTHVLELFHAAIVENEPRATYLPGVYMFLELASGGDLFDKIGKPLNYIYLCRDLADSRSRAST